MISLLFGKRSEICFWKFGSILTIASGCLNRVSGSSKSVSFVA